MNAPSPADCVEAALTPPWGPRLDHFLAARDEIKRPAPAQAPDTFRQEYVFQGDWRPDSEGFLAPDPNGPRPEDPVGMCTCSDLPAVMEAEVLPPAEAVCCDATPAAAPVPASCPIQPPAGSLSAEMIRLRRAGQRWNWLACPQFQPGEGRHETAPSRTTRDAARAARKAKKKGRR